MWGVINDRQVCDLSNRCCLVGIRLGKEVRAQLSARFGGGHCGSAGKQTFSWESVLFCLGFQVELFYICFLEILSTLSGTMKIM